MSSSIRPFSDTIRTGNTARFQPSTSGGVEAFKRTHRENFVGVRAAVRGSIDSLKRSPNIEGSAIQNEFAAPVDVYGRKQPFSKPTVAGSPVGNIPPFNGATMSGLATFANNQVRRTTQQETYKVKAPMGKMGSFRQKEQYGSKMAGSNVTLAQQRADVNMARKEGFGPMRALSKTGSLTLADQRALILEKEKFGPKRTLSKTGSLTLAEQQALILDKEMFGPRTGAVTGNLTLAQQQDLINQERMEMYKRRNARK
jgi:hypothetical protein